MRPLAGTGRAGAGAGAWSAAVEAEAPRVRVDVHPAAADEAGERDARRVGEVRGERGGRGYARDDRDAGGGRLLHDLEAGATAHREHRGRPARRSRAELRGPDERADRLVDGVVTADVLRRGEHRAVVADERGRVERARA